MTRPCLSCTIPLSFGDIINFTIFNNKKLASCPWGSVTANGVDLLTKIYVIYQSVPDVVKIWSRGVQETWKLEPLQKSDNWLILIYETNYKRMFLFKYGYLGRFFWKCFYITHMLTYVKNPMLEK